MGRGERSGRATLAFSNGLQREGRHLVSVGQMQDPVFDARVVRPVLKQQKRKAESVSVLSVRRD